jgi:hypothetical protein
MGRWHRCSSISALAYGCRGVGAGSTSTPETTSRACWRSGCRPSGRSPGPGFSCGPRKQVQRRNLPEGWVISTHPARTALVSEADSIAAQDTATPRGPAGSAVRRYLLVGLLVRGRCDRRLESAWSRRQARLPLSPRTQAPQPPRPGEVKNVYAVRTRSSRTYPSSPSCCANPASHGQCSAPYARNRVRREIMSNGADSPRGVCGTDLAPQAICLGMSFHLGMRPIPPVPVISFARSWPREDVMPSVGRPPGTKP